jgi:hypothetical protein
VWDIVLFFQNPLVTVTVVEDIVNKAMIDLNVVLKGEITILDESGRRALAEKYNLPKHCNITMTFDGSLFQVKKSLDKIVQADNWGYKGFECRNVQFGVLADGRIGSLSDSGQGKQTDITEAKYQAVFKQLSETEDKSYDKGYDGIQVYTNAHILQYLELLAQLIEFSTRFATSSTCYSLLFPLLCVLFPFFF